MIKMLLYQILVCTSHRKKLKKKSYKNKLKISVPTWNKKLDLTDGSYSVSDTQDYFEHIFKNTEKRLIVLL